MASLTRIRVYTSFSDRPKRCSTGEKAKLTPTPNRTPPPPQKKKNTKHPKNKTPPHFPLSTFHPHAAAHSIHHPTIALRRWKTTTTMPWPVSLPVHSLRSRWVHVVHLHQPNKYRSLPVVQINYDWRQRPLSLLPLFLCPNGHAWARH